MENMTLLKCDNFSPSQVFFKNFSLCKWKLTMRNVSKEHLHSVADFWLHVRGLFIVYNINELYLLIILRSTMLQSYVVYIFNQKLNKSSQQEKQKLLLSIPIYVFKVFMSCVLGYIFLILKLLPESRRFRIKKFL